MIYSFALTFEPDLNNKILTYYQKIRHNLNLSFGLEQSSVIHATILKFVSSEKITDTTTEKLLVGVPSRLSVHFSGLTILPSDQECWIEISILKNSLLIELQKHFAKKLNHYKIISDTDELFRPHITLAKTLDHNIPLKTLDSQLLRLKDVTAKNYFWHK